MVYSNWKNVTSGIMEYACIIWSPHTTKDITTYTLEAIQSCAACWACNSRWIPIPHCGQYNLMNVYQCYIGLVYRLVGNTFHFVSYICMYCILLYCMLYLCMYDACMMHVCFSVFV